MADINISASTRTSIIELQKARLRIDSINKSLATGLVVSSPLDSPSAFFDAISLSYQSSRLLDIKDSVARAATIQGGAIAALDAIISTLEQMKATANSPKGDTVSGLVTTTATGTYSATAASNVVTTEIAGAVDGDAFDITYNGTTTTITNTNGSTFTSIAGQISAITGLTATVTDGNPIVITDDAGKDITITDGTGTLAADLGLSSSTNGTIDHSASRKNAETSYDLLRSQIDTLAGDATILGVNLVKSAPDEITIYFDENGGSTITITGVETSASSLSITAVDAADSFATDAGIEAAVAEIEAALTTIAQTKASFQTYDEIINARLNFADALIQNLDDGVSKLVGADINQQSANLLALQTRHDISVTGLGFSFKNGTALTSMLTYR
ncbi:MAG: hypothetical protein HQ504_11730 [Rhodospirillaceae bacterium]|nr:hypothetical protein [Rhodospirillaceae bacterium]